MPSAQLTSQSQLQSQPQSQTSSSSSSASPVGLFSEPSSSSTEQATSDQASTGPSWSTQAAEPQAPTPSLCSDDGPEKEDDHDQPPSTPPPIGPSRSMFRFRGTGIPVTPSEHSRSLILDKSLLLKPQDRQQEQGPEQEQDTPQHIDHHADYEDSFIPIHPVTPEDPTGTQLESTVFRKRIPVSPLPAKSPRKPHPPNRRRSTPHPKKLLLTEDHEGEELPPALSFSTPPIAISTPGPVTHPPPESTLDTPNIFNDSRPLRQARHPPSRIPVPSSRRHASSTQPSDASKPQSTRRLTLGEELWIAAQSDGLNPENEDEVEDDLYVGTGTRSKNRGFLAHGGAGGNAVFMGTGYVEGAEEEREEQPNNPRSLIDEN